MQLFLGLTVFIETGDSGDSREIIQTQQLIPYLVAVSNLGAADRMKQYHGGIIHYRLDIIRLFLIGILKSSDKFLNDWRITFTEISIRHYSALNILVGYFNQRIGMPQIGAEQINILNVKIGQLGNYQTGFAG